MLPGIRVIGKVAVEAKLLAAEPRILLQNRLMVTAMLGQVKSLTAGNTPTGPGHFGYHGRDTMKIEVRSEHLRTDGALLGAPQMYWREYGTKGRNRKQGRALGLSISEIGKAFRQGGLSGGERAYQTAHKALGLTRRMIKLYYGGIDAWWRA